MNKCKEYVSSKEIQRKYHISSSTLRRWNSLGKISSIRTPGNHRLYDIHEFESLFLKKIEKRKICYARVSSNHQKQDLERQIQDLQRKYPNHEIISDIGSGLNWKRKGIEKLLKEVIDGNIEEVICTHKDRLCRFGFELIEILFKKFGTKLIILNSNIKCQDFQQELAEDLLSIINIFVAKNNGKRSGKNRKRRKEEKKEVEKNKKLKL